MEFDSFRLAASGPADWRAEAERLRENKPRCLLFLCVHNSARSQMAEGIARSLAPESVRVYSAGSSPSSVHPLAVRALAEAGIDISGHTSKGLQAVPLEEVEAVITLCAEEVCPLFPRKVTSMHWPMADPAAATGDADARLDAFRRVRDELTSRLEVVFANPPAQPPPSPTGA